MTDNPVGALVRRILVDPIGRLRHRLRTVTTASPARFAVLIFVSLILVFTALFSLPAAAADGTATPLVDALFTAVSTICVTGLSTVDMGTHWSAGRMHFEANTARPVPEVEAPVLPPTQACALLTSLKKVQLSSSSEGRIAH